MFLYATADDAAVAALNRANPTSIRENVEYGGIIFRTADGRYGYTVPQRGTVRGFSLSRVALPTDVTEVGNYHTHGDYSQPAASGLGYVRARSSEGTMGSLLFSSDDLKVAATRASTYGIRDYRAYLGRPNGEYLFYDVSTGNVGKLPKRRPWPTGPT